MTMDVCKNTGPFEIFELRMCVCVCVVFNMRCLMYVSSILNTIIKKYRFTKYIFVNFSKAEKNLHPALEERNEERQYLREFHHVEVDP